LGGGQQNQTSVYYKLNGGGSQTLGLTTPGGGDILPPAGGCSVGNPYSDIVLTMDMSSSMSVPFTGQPYTGPDSLKFRIQRTAAAELVNNVVTDAAGNKVGIVQFNDSATLLSSLSTDKTALTNILNNMNTYSIGTNYISGITMTSQQLQSTPLTRDKVMVFMSDGVPDRPNYGDPNIIPNILAATTNMKTTQRTVIYTIGVDVPAGSTEENLMKSMAGGIDSKGQTGFYTSVQDKTGFDNIAQQLSGILTCS
jgi:hypothetical protein